MESLISRDEVKAAFAPLVPFVEDAVEKARVASSHDVIANANPQVTRVAHLRRLSGTKRWMVLADDLVAQAPGMPEGFGMESTDADHNQGKYAIRFPLGVCTIRREPHDEEEGKYLQERLEGVLEQAQLAPGIDAFAGIKAYISVPPEGAVRLIATHPAFPEPMVILLDEIEVETGAVTAVRPSAPMPLATVSSALAEDGNAADGETS